MLLPALVYISVQNADATEMTSRSILRALAGVVLLVSGAWPVLAQSNACSEPQVSATAGQVDSARNALLELPIGNGLQTDVSPRAQTAIAVMKDRLAVFIDTYMKCASPEPDAAKVQADLSALGHAYRMRQGIISKAEEPKDLGKYGFELWFEAKSVPKDRLFAVTATFAIECGSDTMLLIYAPKNSSWEQVLRWESKPYKQVSGAFSAFNYGISPRDGSGNWYAVAAHLSPWCSSTWSTIYYSVLRPSPISNQPTVLFSGSDGIWWGNEDFGKLAVSQADFDLRFHAESIDPDVHDRTWIRHFAVSGNAVRRVEPVAETARDFADEWIVSPWNEASAWSATDSATRLEESHERLSGLQSAANGIFTFESIRACSDEPNHRQVELSYENSEHYDFFFQVKGGANFVLSDVDEKPDSYCDGPNELGDSGE